jgi:hypothetical protein
VQTSHVQAPAPAPFRQPAVAQHQATQPEAELNEEIEFEEEVEPRRRGRTLMIVGALVGAIFVGGGLAYTYRAFSGGGKTPILTADKSAVKTKCNMGAGAGQKVAEQAPMMPEVAPRSQVASESDTTSGPPRVKTIPVGPDGNILSMPGIAVTMPPPLPQRQAELPPQQQPPQNRQPLAAQAPLTQAPAPVQPKVITPQQRQAAVPEVPPAPEKKKQVKPRESDAYTPGAVDPTGSAPKPGPSPAPSPATKSGLGAGGNGFVAAILSTPKGRLEAMKSFADLQSKYPDVLNGKPAEVQEVNLGEVKGVWYRAVVGPPGSKASASAVCEQLKAAGYTQCFATAY